MKLPRRQFLHLAAGAAALPIVPGSAFAGAYPARPVQMIVGFPPGSAPDIIARLSAQWLGERLGQNFVVENRPGAGSNIGTEAVVRSQPDGYTILTDVLSNVLNASLYQNLSFNFMRDIAPVATVANALTLSWSLRHCPPRPFRSSSPTPRRIQARSIWHQAESAPPLTSLACCS